MLESLVTEVAIRGMTDNYRMNWCLCCSDKVERNIGSRDRGADNNDILNRSVSYVRASSQKKMLTFPLN